MVATSPCFYVHFPLVDKLCWAYESSKIGKTKKPVLWGAHSEKLGHYMHKPTTAPGRNWDLRGLLLIVLCPGQELQWKGVLISLLTSVSLFLFALVAGAFPLFSALPQRNLFELLLIWYVEGRRMECSFVTSCWCHSLFTFYLQLLISNYAAWSPTLFNRIAVERFWLPPNLPNTIKNV